MRLDSCCQLTPHDHRLFAVTVFPVRPPSAAPPSSPSSPFTLIHLDRAGSHGVYHNPHQRAEEGTLSVLAGGYVFTVCTLIMRPPTCFSGVAATIAASITQ